MPEQDRFFFLFCTSPLLISAAALLLLLSPCIPASPQHEIQFPGRLNSDSVLYILPDKLGRECEWITCHQFPGRTINQRTSLIFLGNSFISSKKNSFLVLWGIFAAVFMLRTAYKGKGPSSRRQKPKTVWRCGGVKKMKSEADDAKRGVRKSRRR